jgi:GT2 family glycosyltransferase
MGWAERAREGRHPRIPLIDRPGVIAVCSGDRTTYPQFSADVATLQSPRGSLLHWRISGGGDLARARNDHVEKALEYDAGWIWFIDDDHVFATDILLRLLRHDKDLCVPAVMTRKEPHRWIACAPFPVKSDASDAELAALTNVSVPYPQLRPHQQGLVEIGLGGTGGVLISRELLDAMPAPWFEWGRFGADGAGEDTWFFLKARRLGYRIWCDLSAELGHLTTAVVWPSRHPETGAMVPRIHCSEFSPPARRTHAGFATGA